MVVGPLSGDEVPFPINPIQDDEFHGTNKFLYKWDTNRWKNIHRPLIIPDYIWPGINPLDPLDGGGGDDWTREALSLTVSGAGFNKVPAFTIPVNVPSGPYQDSFTGLFPTDILYYANYNGDNGIADHLNEFVVTFSNTAVGIPPAAMHLSYRQSDSSWFSGYQTAALQIGPRTRVRLVLRISDCINNVARLDETNWRFTTHHIWDPRTGQPTYQGGFYQDVRIGFAQANGTYLPSLGVDTYLGDRGLPRPDPVDVSIEVSPTDDHPDLSLAEYCYVEFDCNTGQDWSSMVVSIFDPEGPALLDTTPIALATDKQLRYSIVGFDKAAGEDSLMSFRHNNPGLFNDSVQKDTAALSGFLDVDDESVQTPDIAATFLREDGSLMAIARSDNMTIEFRDLWTPWDITTHSAIFDDANGYYNFTDYSTKSGTITGTTIHDMAVDPTGLYLYLLVDTDLRRYTMSTAWEVNSINVGVFDTVDLSTYTPTIMDISAGGSAIVIGKAGSMKQLILDTLWDITTAIDTGTERAFEIDNPQGLVVSDDSKTLIVLDISNDPNDPYQIIRYTRNV